MRSEGRRVGDSRNDEVNEVNKRGMNVSGALCSKWEEYIDGINMILGVIGKLGRVCNLGGV